MAQQVQFKKLKEQIEAAKRGLTEMADVEINDSAKKQPRAGSANESSPSALPEFVQPKHVKTFPGDVLSGESIDTRVVDMKSKQVLSDAPIADDTIGDSVNEVPGEFQFFHREKQLKGESDTAFGQPLGEAGDIGSEYFLFERLNRRLAILEGDVEQNRKYILELISLLSKLDLSRKSAKRNLKPSQRLNRRHIFWFVIGLLAVCWFGLTPSGHVAVKHFLTFIKSLSTIFYFH